MIQTNLTRLYPQNSCPKVRKMRPPLLKQQLLEPTNLVQWLASRDVILSAWRNRKARKSSQNALVLPLYMYLPNMVPVPAYDFSSNPSGSLKTMGTIPS